MSIDINNLTRDNKKAFRNKALDVGFQGNLIAIFSAFLQGKLYYKVKKTLSNEEYKICLTELYAVIPLQANRYVQFYLLVNKFPPLLVVDKTFSEIVNNAKALEEAVENDKEFEALLKSPIYEMKRPDGTLVDFHKLVKSLDKDEIDQEMKELYMYIL